MTSKSKNITFIFIKVIACLSIVGIIPAFLLIRNYYKKVARKTIHDDNILIIQNLFEQQINPSKKIIHELYDKRLIHIDKYLHIDDVEEIKRQIAKSQRREALEKTPEQLEEEFKKHIKEKIPELAGRYHLKNELVEIIVNAEGLNQESFNIREEKLHEIQALIEKTDEAIVENFLYKDLTADNGNEQLANLEWVISLISQFENGESDESQMKCIKSFLVACKEELLANKENPKMIEVYKKLFEAAITCEELAFKEENAEKIGKALAVPIEHQMIINGDNNFEKAIETITEALSPGLFTTLFGIEKNKRLKIIETIKHHI